MSLYTQPLVAFTYTKVNAEPFALTTRLEAAPKMLDPFLAIVKLLEERLLPLSINVTSLPIAGDAGKVTVTELLIPAPEVSINN